MKNFKRILALVIATIMVVGTFASVSAAGDKWYSKAVAYIEDCGIAVIGTKADSKITRNEFVMWVAKLESHQLEDDAWFDEIANVEFSDVTPDHHRAAIAYSHERGFIIGNGDGTFSPDKIISFAEASAVIVRLMGYENKVTDTSAEKWAYNYMQVANTYCKAIDDTFLSHTGTYNPDYELTHGEAAYLLATIMNFGKTTDDKNYSRTSDGIDLGEYFEDAKVGRIGKSYYVADITRKSAGTSKSSPLALGGKGQKYTNEIDTAKDVTLIATDASGSLVVSGEDFLKLLRVSLGLAPERDIANEEPEINVFEKVDVGSIVNTVVDKADGSVKSISVSENSVAVDTYLQGKTASVNGGYGSGSNPAATTIASADDLPKYLGWIVREATGTTNDYKPVLPASYSDALVTSWTNVKKSATGVVTSATLNFQGKTYKVDDKNNEINIYVVENNELKLLTADEAVKTLINAAQGECYVVFNDVDGNGIYDTAIVKESSPFLYTADLEIPSTDDTVRDYLSSVSGGTVVGQSTVKGKEVGTVVFNKKVLTGGAAGGSDSTTYMSTDSFVFSTKAADATGKVQLVLCASNKHFIVDGVYSDYNISLPFYAAVDIASFATGVIEEVDPFAVNGYWVAKIRSVDGSTVQTVYIPNTASETVTLPVTIGAATAEYTFNSSTWLKFLTEDLEAAIEEGIVSAVGDPGHRASTAAWMAGKYVQYAVDTDNVAIALLGTDVVTGDSGFVTGVTKTDTGDNTFKVTIATSKKGGAVGNVYLQKVVDSMIGNDVAAGQHIKVDDQGRLICRNTGEKVYAKDMETGKMYEYSVEDYNNWVNGTSASIASAVESADYADTTDYGWHRVTVAGEYNYGILAADGTIKKQDKDGDGIPDVCGWYADNMFDYVDNRGAYGVGGVKTVEVRANASSMFDWENYKVYNALFSGKLGDPNGMEDGKVNPGEDLIYVTVAQDAGNLKYLLYGDRNAYADNSATKKSASFRIGNAGTGKNIYGSNAWWYMLYEGEIAPQDAWKDVEGEYILSITPIAGSKTDTEDQYGTVNGYTEEYTAKVGFGPYYERTYNTSEKAYEYVLKFTRVESYTAVTGTASAEVDKTSLLMTPLYYGESGKESIQVKATTPEDLAKYTIADGYYVDSTTKLVYIIHNSDSVKISYKKDNSGKLICTTKYDWTNATKDATFVPTEEDVLFSTYKLGKYATLTYKAKDRAEDGWYPGASYLVIDGKMLACSTSTPVVIVTPSKDGFTTTVTTVGALPEQGLFVTAWNAAETNGAITGIAVLGEVATEKTDDNQGGNTPILKQGETLVYLDKTANPIVRAAAYGKNWLVISDKSAYALPTGEDVGAIYREYSTYEEATKAANIELSVTGGHWYRVDENGKIIEDMTTVTYQTYRIIDLSDGYKTVELKGSFSGSNFGKDPLTAYILSDVEVTTPDPEKVYLESYASSIVPDGTIGIRDNGNGTITSYTIKQATYFTNYNDSGKGLYNYKFTGAKTETAVQIKPEYLVSGTTNDGLYKMGDLYFYYDGTNAYVVDENFRRVETSTTLSGVKTGTLTYTNVSGTSTLATIDGVEKVEISGYNFAWFYRNADGSVLYKAGNSSSVEIASAETYAAAYKTEQDAYNKALANYNKAVGLGYLSEERIAYYKEILDNAEAALIAKKNALLDKYFNGQFWNCPNSPYYVYIQKSLGGFQETVAKLSFNYIVVKDAAGNNVYCVFSDEYTFG